MARASNLKPALPGLDQEPLVNACLEQDVGRARSTALTWLEATPLDAMDVGCRRFLPLLYWRLTSAGVVHPLLSPLRAQYRHHWANAHAGLHRTAEVVAALEAAGIPALVLKGLPLAFSVYPDPGTRPMGDVDLLVPAALAEAAIERLHALGGVRKGAKSPQISGWSPGSVLRLQHAAHFELPRGGRFDLHWFSLEECCSADADHGFWTRRVKFSASGVTLATLSPADQLLHLCVHGLRADRSESSMRWLVDAALLLRTHGSTLDWDVLLGEARHRRVSFTVAEALAELAAYVTIPRGIEGRLRSQVASRWERWAHCSNVSTLPRHKFAALWMRHVRSTPDLSTFARIAAFPRYLQGRWSAPTIKALFLHAIRQARKK